MVHMTTLRCDDITLHANSIQLSRVEHMHYTLYLYLWILFDSHSSVQQFIFCQAERMSKVLRWMLVWWARIRIFTLLHFTMCNFCMAHTIQFDDERVFLSAEASERMHRWNLIKMSIDLFHSKYIWDTTFVRTSSPTPIYGPTNWTNAHVEILYLIFIFVRTFEYQAPSTDINIISPFIQSLCSVPVTSVLMWKRCMSLETQKMAR